MSILVYQFIKSLVRSARFDENIVFKILAIFSSVYFCALIFFLGKNYGVILQRFRPLADPIEVFNKFLFYAFPIDCLLRFFFQKNNLRFANIYMHLPIRRSRIILYYILVKFFNIFNLGFLIFIIPFSCVNVLTKYGWDSFMLYLLSIILILIFITYFTYLLKTLSSYHILFSLIPLAWIILVFVFKFVYQVDPETFTANMFDKILNGNWIIILLIAVLAASMSLSYFSLLKKLLYNIYSNNVKNNINIKIRPKSHSLKYTSTFILFELFIMFRNRRIRSLLVTPLYFLLLTYLIFSLKQIDDFIIIFFWYLCLSGVWGYSYLQVVFSIESSFFDFISIANLDFKKYLKCKYALIVIISIVISFAALPIIFIKAQNVHIIASALLYNISIGYFLVFATGTLNKMKMDLNSGMLFNYQGNNPIQIISICVAFLIPLAFLGIITFFLSQRSSLLIMNSISLISLLNYKGWFQFISRQFSVRKYRNLEGYRK